MQVYCFKCKKKISPVSVRQTTTKTGKPRLAGKCPHCHGGVSRMLPVNGRGVINTVLNNATGILPELHLRTTLQRPIGTKYSWAGPLTRLNERLNPDGTWKDWSAPVNRVDHACYYHDLAYEQFDDIPNRHEADRELMERLLAIEDPTAEERLARMAITKVFKQKIKRGMGIFGEMFGKRGQRQRSLN